ncbi:MAG: anhydro-N-acetylmuramic acid kinase [Bacteroidota bacterium]
MESYRVIGLMSGSSLDGLDIAYCEFRTENNKWSFKILKTSVVEYPDEWMQEIKGLPVSNAKTLWETHAGLGSFFGQQVNEFIKKNSLKDKVDLVASHGHTIFHFPEKKFTTQIGDGAAISARTNLPVACDFRSADIADGGQGTPIVPIGDKLLFPHFRFCLNIGGIANISCKTEHSIVAFDICCANQILNMLANRTGKDYDAGGEIAASGSLNQELLEKLNALEYYKLSYPKSLDNSFSREMILPLLEELPISIEDKMRTYAEHIAFQVGNHVTMISKKEKIEFGAKEKILATGGGAFNKFLMERIHAQTKMNVEVPGDETVKFKEALVIAFMGVLRMRNEVNVLKSVTGASKDSIGGAVYRP